MPKMLHKQEVESQKITEKMQGLVIMMGWDQLTATAAKGNGDGGPTVESGSGGRTKAHRR